MKKIFGRTVDKPNRVVNIVVRTRFSSLVLFGETNSARSLTNWLVDPNEILWAYSSASVVGLHKRPFLQTARHKLFSVFQPVHEPLAVSHGFQAVI